MKSSAEAAGGSKLATRGTLAARRRSRRARWVMASFAGVEASAVGPQEMRAWRCRPEKGMTCSSFGKVETIAIKIAKILAGAYDTSAFATEI